jgi:hypothetical protein
MHQPGKQLLSHTVRTMGLHPPPDESLNNSGSERNPGYSLGSHEDNESLGNPQDDESLGNGEDDDENNEDDESEDGSGGAE